uniref:Cdc42 effector protein 2-like protein n=1 Tax=Callorhinchus milii TaxID=7868 RepID=V9LC67_CALMI
MSVKTPIYLKTSSPKKGKKLKLRDMLSGDMISPPLGDFRHRSHIGQSGENDVFGDVSFLKGQHDLLSTLKRSKEPEESGPPKPPRLHLEEPEEEPTYLTRKAPNFITADHRPPSPDPAPEAVGLQQATRLWVAGTHPHSGMTGEDTSSPMSELTTSESMFTFDLDLGPSILGDILKIMDNHKS